MAYPHLYLTRKAHATAVRRPNPADTESRKMAGMSEKHYGRPGQAMPRFQQPVPHQYGHTNQSGQSYGMHPNNVSDPSTLAHPLQGMSLGHQPYGTQGKTAIMSSAAAHYPGMSIPNAMPSNMYNTNGGQYVYPNNYVASTTAPHSALYTPHHGTNYMPQVNYGTYHQHDNSPLSQSWTPTTTGGATADVPTLITPRRGSISSNENDQPATPSYANYAAYGQSGITINRSPSGMYAHSTPSPASVMAYGMAVPKQPDQSDVSPRIKMLVSREPAIPRAIPAPSSPLKPLDRALENQRGETNVYIRGLLPETSDAMLEQWGLRFGDIKSSKSIIEQTTGLCKGFGFVKYHNYEDAENCIRGFHYLGYEVSFARESFYSKLKTFADETNTNLYVSNLPKSMNEHELANLFAPHKVCSSRILRDKNGHGRGVGFARFEARDACEEVIKAFNNYTIESEGEEMQMQIRYADTQEQKSLKQQTQAARQFRSAEYEYATQAWRQGRMGYAASPGHDGQGSSEFDRYLGTSAAVPIQAQRWASSRQLNGRSPLAAAPYTVATQPLVQITVSSNSDSASAITPSDDASVETKAVTTSPVTAHAISPVDSAAASVAE